MRFYADSAYWTENIVGLLKQHSLIPVISPKSNALLDTPLLGPIVRAHRFYPGLYKHNHHPEYRSSVEHVFGLLKLSFPPILDLLPSTILIQYSLQSSHLLQLSLAPTTLLTREKKFLDMLIIIEAKKLILT
ncbi:MAG: hypothetical protein ACTSYD_04495 [Candidatus Heimdallarchaeaceae archaeon]